jgi:hypothetical protein
MVTDNEAGAAAPTPGGFICRVEPVLDQCGPLRAVPGIPYEVPVPSVLDLDYRTGHPLRVRMDLGPGGGFGLRALTFTAAAEADDVSGQTLRAARISETVAHVHRYLRNAERDYRHLGVLTGTTLTVPKTWDPAQARRRRLNATNVPGMVLTPAGFKIDPKHREQLRRLGPSSVEVASTVATLYRTAAEAGRAPVDFVAQMLELPKRTASHWVKLAREAGALEVSTRRSANRGHDGDD